MILRPRLFGLALALVVFGAAAACVDGVTPDCSDAAVCAPIEGDAAGGADDAAPPTETPDASTPAPDADTGGDAAEAGADGG